MTAIAQNPVAWHQRYVRACLPTGAHGTTRVPKSTVWRAIKGKSGRVVQVDFSGKFDVDLALQMARRAMDSGNLEAAEIILDQVRNYVEAL
jgi:hypothetical protein